MPSRPTLLFAISSAALVMGGGAVAFTGCTTTVTEESPGVAEGGADAPADRRTVDATPQQDTGPTLGCEEQCFADHPAAKAKYDAVDTCWGASCQGPCVDGTGTFDGGADAAAEGGAVHDGGNGLCQTEIASGVDQACDECTEQFCCTSWKGCYDDNDCLDLNDCLVNCP
jgi:hypothetical protein